MRHVEPCSTAILTRSRERIYLAYMDRKELIAGLDCNTFAGLLPDHHQRPRHPRVLVKEG